MPGKSTPRPESLTHPELNVAPARNLERSDEPRNDPDSRETSVRVREQQNALTARQSVLHCPFLASNQEASDPALSLEQSEGQAEHRFVTFTVRLKV